LHQGSYLLRYRQALIKDRFPAAKILFLARATHFSTFEGLPYVLGPPSIPTATARAKKDRLDPERLH
jgi:hypothetical protein